MAYGLRRIPTIGIAVARPMAGDTPTAALGLGGHHPGNLEGGASDDIAAVNRVLRMIDWNFRQLPET